LRADGAIADFLKPQSGPWSEHPGRRVVAWATAGAAVLLAAGGAWALATSASRKDTFFAEHVNENGEIYGISPADAADHEATTRRWDLLGGLLLAGAGAAGITATVVFLSDGKHAEPEAALVGVAAKF
jgi:hypothetical protein